MSLENKNQLVEELEKLEAEHNQLWSEIVYVDTLMRLVGFSDGLNTVKAAARKISESDEEYIDYDDYDDAA